MQERTGLYAFGSNLHQQLQTHDQNGDPLCLPTPVIFSPNGQPAQEVVALSASQIVYRASLDEPSRFGITGFANDNGFLQDSLQAHYDVRTWLGRDTIKAFLTQDGELVSARQCTNTTRFKAAAMDAHGRILTITGDEIRLYNDLDKFYDDNYSKISDPEHIDVSNPTIQAGSAHFIILAKSKDAGVAVLAVGDNRFFQQGHPYPSSWTQARRVDFFDEGVSSVVKVACGDLHTAFLCADGAAYMSGSDAKGQCGGFSEQEPCMIDLGEEDSGGEEMDVLDVVCGASHTIAMATRGIYATGSRQLGTGNTKDSPTFMRVFLHNGITNASRVAAAGWNTIVAARNAF